jgi:serine/threonine protein kinase/tetratricopeptide (TPR) repeat protein
MPNSERVQALFAAAIELPAQERAAYLDAECRGDASLRAEVESLLQSHDAAGAFLSMPTVGDGTWTAPRASAPSSELPGTRIGPYTLLEQLGEGGFGTVFLAEQSTPVARKVALKIIKLGMDTRQVVARFEHERQALALMDHPGIAKVFDAGATETGRPYFVMELVRGEPIVAYCDTHNLSIDARLALFAEVCLAVQHAHTKGIIHRDLKPTNILVTTQDGKPHAKVIDFGIAKAIDSNLAERTVFTELRQLVGTPEYMSPEQAEGSLDVDTRTDVYSLGVLLYELLTGTTPFVGRELRSAAYAEIQRIIREVEPPKPSTRLSSNADTIASVAARRQVAPRRLGSIVKGELDWVVMKALEKDRQRRYDSANDFAADVRRYLTGEAVVAAPPSAWYRASKFVRRNRAAAIAASAVAAALLLGLAGTAWQATIASREARAARDAESAATLARDAERKRADELKRVSDFQSNMLAQIDPARAGADLMADVRARYAAALEKSGVAADERSQRVDAFDRELVNVNATDAAAAMIDRTILRPAVTTIDEQFKDQPVVDAQLRESLATLYQAIGLYDAAMPLRESALATRRRALGDDHPDTLDSISGMGNLLLAQAKTAQAEPLLREALERKRRVLGEAARATLTAISDVGSLLRAEGKLAEAEPFFRGALDKRRQSLGDDDPETLLAMNNLGYLLLAQGKPDEAAPLYREALDRRRRVLGEDHRDTLFSLNNMGTLLSAQGKAAEAEKCFRDALAGRRRALGEEHPETLTSLNDLGNQLRSEGKLAEAEPLLREAYEKNRRVLGPTHRFTFTAMNNLAMVMRAQGKLDEAEKWYREVLGLRRRVLGEEHPDTIISINNLAFALQAQNKLAEATACYREGYEKALRVHGEQHPLTVALATQLGRVLQLQGKNDDAIALLAATEPAARRVFRGATADRLAMLLTALGRARAGLAYDVDRFQLAEANLVEARQIFATLRGPDHADTRGAAQSLVQFYEAWERSDPGQGHAAKGREIEADLQQSAATTRSATSTQPSR